MAEICIVKHSSLLLIHKWSFYKVALAVSFEQLFIDCQHSSAVK